MITESSSTELELTESGLASDDQTIEAPRSSSYTTLTNTTSAPPLTTSTSSHFQQPNSGASLRNHSESVRQDANVNFDEETSSTTVALGDHLASTDRQQRETGDGRSGQSLSFRRLFGSFSGGRSGQQRSASIGTDTAATTSAGNEATGSPASTDRRSSSHPIVVGDAADAKPLSLGQQQLQPQPLSTTSSISSLSLPAPTYGGVPLAGATLTATPTGSSGGAAGTRRKSREYIRRASQVLISLTSPSSAGELAFGECSRRDSRLVPQITLFNCCLQRLPMKDFGAEVRAAMDVDQFLQQAVLLLDVNETSIEGIVDRMVGKVSFFGKYFLNFFTYDGGIVLILFCRSE